ncbi:hypothetical protein [Actibacterium sp. D379-3]
MTLSIGLALTSLRRTPPAGWRIGTGNGAAQILQAPSGPAAPTVVSVGDGTATLE